MKSKAQTSFVRLEVELDPLGVQSFGRARTGQDRELQTPRSRARRSL
jgi:hypothetical protein